MLSEEEKKAIEYLKCMKNRLDFNKIGYVYAKEYIETVLNHITKLQEESNRLNSYIKENEIYKKRLFEYAEKKDKQIDLMADYITLYKTEKENPNVPDGFSVVKKVSLSKKETKQYFKKLAEEKGEY